MKAAEVRQRLATILTSDLDFHDRRSNRSTHALHAFAAKFPPQLPRVFIRQLTAAGAVVLDPMAGSGTTLVETLLQGRRAIGVDLDPLAIRLCRVKTRGGDIPALAAAGAHVLTAAEQRLQDAAALTRELDRRYAAPERSFLDYWFYPTTQRELLALLLGIEAEPRRWRRTALEVIFSAIIITKSGGVTRATDLAHTRPHRVVGKEVRSALAQFRLRLRQTVAALETVPRSLQPVKLHHADARQLPLPDESVDLVVTSPPYANAIDYMRAHKFALVWFGEPVARLRDVRATYIGADHTRGPAVAELPAAGEQAVSAVAERDGRKAKVLRKYLGDMRGALSEMHRVLRPSAAAALVVGPSTMRGYRVRSHEYLAAIAEQVGFETVGIGQRQLDRNRRLLPARQRGAGSGIEQRMHEEFVVGLLKP